ncbi:thioesterase family protein [Terrimonas sp. NA20]|uniref:Thioesterase family protein n=1 Tax=Terrimonas ginsenosidimutans TaxID=2908004 RepID=A0ABS9KRR8_9BACT|nr:thioesterase family protein [Terrimonas ginsenosidimutans]MCG2614984.1 thioesterase family protein [Terrimonas ginsenosidimutans]
MARIRLEMPSDYSFSTLIPVRITDINYGGHMGNDAILSLIHEARMQYLRSFGYTELDFAGIALIMADVGIEFKKELFYGDTVNVSVCAGDFTKLSFDLYYKLEKEVDGNWQTVALAKTGMVCYDYAKKKVSALPVEAKEKLSF